MSLLLYNVRINGEAGYVLIRGNRIEKVGYGSLPDATQRIDMKEAELHPGFCDSHTHLSNVALMHGTLDLTGLTRDEILGLISSECGKREVIVGRGWDESFWDRKEYLTRDELDAVCDNVPVFLIREDGHIAAVNSAIIRKFGIGDDQGLVREKDISKLSDLLGVFKTLDFEYAQNYALSKGITCVHDFASPDTFKKYFLMRSKGELKVRIYANFYMDSYRFIRELGLYSGFGDPFLRIGALKLFADGSIGAKTAATRYLDGKTVKPMINRSKLFSIVREANSHGVRVFTHAIGDLAIEEVIGAYSLAGRLHMNRIEHYELPYEEHMLEGLEVSMQPNFLKWAKEGGLYQMRLGSEVLFTNNPYRRILDSKMILLFGSDCMPMDPMFGIKMAVGSEYPMQRISYSEAVGAYTRGATYMHPLLGKIKEGYIADLVALDERGILLTMVDGKIGYMRKNLNA